MMEKSKPPHRPLISGLLFAYVCPLFFTIAAFIRVSAISYIFLILGFVLAACGMPLKLRLIHKLIPIFIIVLVVASCCLTTATEFVELPSYVEKAIGGIHRNSIFSVVISEAIDFAVGILGLFAVIFDSRAGNKEGDASSEDASKNKHKGTFLDDRYTSLTLEVPASEGNDDLDEQEDGSSAKKGAKKGRLFSTRKTISDPADLYNEAERIHPGPRFMNGFSDLQEPRDTKVYAPRLSIYVLLFSVIFAAAAAAFVPSVLGIPYALFVVLIAISFSRGKSSFSQRLPRWMNTTALIICCYVMLHITAVYLYQFTWEPEESSSSSASSSSDQFSFDNFVECQTEFGPSSCRKSNDMNTHLFGLDGIDSSSLSSSSSGYEYIDSSFERYMGLAFFHDCLKSETCAYLISYGLSAVLFFILSSSFRSTILVPASVAQRLKAMETGPGSLRKFHAMSPVTQSSTHSSIEEPLLSKEDEDEAEKAPAKESADDEEKKDHEAPPHKPGLEILNKGHKVMISILYPHGWKLCLLLMFCAGIMIEGVPSLVLLLIVIISTYLPAIIAPILSPILLWVYTILIFTLYIFSIPLPVLVRIRQENGNLLSDLSLPFQSLQWAWLVFSLGFAAIVFIAIFVFLRNIVNVKLLEVEGPDGEVTDEIIQLALMEILFARRMRRPPPPPHMKGKRMGPPKGFDKDGKGPFISPDGGFRLFMWKLRFGFMKFKKNAKDVIMMLFLGFLKYAYFISLFFVYVTCVRKTNALNFIFMLFFLVFFSNPSFAIKNWRALVAYTQVVFLARFTWQLAWIPDCGKVAEIIGLEKGGDKHVFELLFWEALTLIFVTMQMFIISYTQRKEKAMWSAGHSVDDDDSALEKIEKNSHPTLDLIGNYLTIIIANASPYVTAAAFLVFGTMMSISIVSFIFLFAAFFVLNIFFFSKEPLAHVRRFMFITSFCLAVILFIEYAFQFESLNDFIVKQYDKSFLKDIIELNEVGLVDLKGRSSLYGLIPYFVLFVLAAAQWRFIDYAEHMEEEFMEKKKQDSEKRKEKDEEKKSLLDDDEEEEKKDKEKEEEKDKDAEGDDSETKTDKFFTLLLDFFKRFIFKYTPFVVFVFSAFVFTEDVNAIHLVFLAILLFSRFFRNGLDAVSVLLLWGSQLINGLVLIYNSDSFDVVDKKNSGVARWIGFPRPKVDSNAFLHPEYFRITYEYMVIAYLIVVQRISWRWGKEQAKEISKVSQYADFISKNPREIALFKSVDSFEYSDPKVRSSSLLLSALQIISDLPNLFMKYIVFIMICLSFYVRSNTLAALVYFTAIILCIHKDIKFLRNLARPFAILVSSLVTLQYFFTLGLPEHFVNPFTDSSSATSSESQNMTQENAFYKDYLRYSPDGMFDLTSFSSSSSSYSNWPWKVLSGELQQWLLVYVRYSYVVLMDILMFYFVTAYTFLPEDTDDIFSILRVGRDRIKNFPAVRERKSDDVRYVFYQFIIVVMILMLFLIGCIKEQILSFIYLGFALYLLLNGDFCLMNFSPWKKLLILTYIITGFEIIFQMSFVVVTEFGGSHTGHIEDTLTYIGVVLGFEYTDINQAIPPTSVLFITTLLFILSIVHSIHENLRRELISTQKFNDEKRENQKAKAQSYFIFRIDVVISSIEQIFREKAARRSRLNSLRSSPKRKKLLLKGPYSKFLEEMREARKKPEDKKSESPAPSESLISLSPEQEEGSASTQDTPAQMNESTGGSGSEVAKEQGDSTMSGQGAVYDVDENGEQKPKDSENPEEEGVSLAEKIWGLVGGLLLKVKLLLRDGVDYAIFALHGKEGLCPGNKFEPDLKQLLHEKIEQDLAEEKEESMSDGVTKSKLPPPKLTRTHAHDATRVIAVIKQNLMRQKNDMRARVMLRQARPVSGTERPAPPTMKRDKDGRLVYVKREGPAASLNDSIILDFILHYNKEMGNIRLAELLMNTGCRKEVRDDHLKVLWEMLNTPEREFDEDDLQDIMSSIFVRSTFMDFCKAAEKVVDDGGDLADKVRIVTLRDIFSIEGVIQPLVDDTIKSPLKKKAKKEKMSGSSTHSAEHQDSDDDDDDDDDDDMDDELVLPPRKNSVNGFNDSDDDNHGEGSSVAESRKKKEEEEKPKRLSRANLLAKGFSVFLRSYSEFVCLLAMIACHLAEGTITSTVYVLFAFAYICLATRPHPPRQLWNIIMIYTCVVIMLKFLAEVPGVCMCHSSTYHYWSFNKDNIQSEDPICNLTQCNNDPAEGSENAIKFSFPYMLGILPTDQYFGRTALWDIIILLTIIIHIYEMDSQGIWTQEMRSVVRIQSKRFMRRFEELKNIDKKTNISVFKAIEKVVGKNDLYLSFDVGDRIKLVTRDIDEESEYAVGTINGVSGIFERSKVEPCMEDDVPIIHEELEVELDKKDDDDDDIDEDEYDDGLKVQAADKDLEEGSLTAEERKQKKEIKAISSLLSGGAEEEEGKAGIGAGLGIGKIIGSAAEEIGNKAKKKKKPAGPPLGVRLRMTGRSIIDFYRTLVTDNTRPGKDYYTPMFFLEFLCFVYLLFAAATFTGSEGQLVQYIQQSYLPSSYVFVLLLQFIVIIVDRIIYIRQSIGAKIIMQHVTLVLFSILTLWYFPSKMEINTDYDHWHSIFSKTWTLKLFYVFKCIYWYLSGLQIRDGYPMLASDRFLQQYYTSIHNGIHTGYRTVPFVYELRTILDWTFIPTTLDFWHYLIIEDIYAEVYKVACDIYTTPKRDPGIDRPKSEKCLYGCLFFSALAAILWLPLLIMSSSIPGMGGISIVDVSSVSVSVEIPGWTPLYKSQLTNDLLHIPINATKFAWLKSHYSFVPRDIHSLQEIALPEHSSEVWTSTLAGKTSLMDVLEKASESNDTDGTGVVLRTSLVLSRESGTNSEVPYYHDITLDNVTCGLLRNVIQEGNGAEITLKSPIFHFIRMPGTTDVAKSPCFEESSSTGGCPDMYVRLIYHGEPMNSSSGEDFYTNYWSFSQVPESVKGDKSFFDDGNTTKIVLINTPVSSKNSVVGSLAAYGLIGLYTSIILVVANAVRGIVSGGAHLVMFMQLPDPTKLVNLCKDIILARMDGDLLLEEELCNELIAIYRDPTKLIKHTRSASSPGKWEETSDDVDSDEE